MKYITIYSYAHQLLGEILAQNLASQLKFDRLYVICLHNKFGNLRVPSLQKGKLKAMRGNKKPVWKEKITHSVAIYQPPFYYM